MKYAIIESGGKQYKVSEGETIIVDKVDGEVGKQYNFDKVLLFRNGETIDIGTPYLQNVAVIGKLSATKKGEKIRIAKFKAKIGYRKVMGFRPLQSHLLIEKITAKTSSQKREKSS